MYGFFLLLTFEKYLLDERLEETGNSASFRLFLSLFIYSSIRIAAGEGEGERT